MPYSALFGTGGNNPYFTERASGSGQRLKAVRIDAVIVRHENERPRFLHDPTRLIGS
jgi:hypothetical protein